MTPYNFLLSSTILLTISTYLPVTNHTSMSELNLDTMRLLFAEQSKTLISELKAQVISEVAEQLVPHAARLDLLHDDQILLKKQISELSSIFQSNPPTIPVHPATATTIDNTAHLHHLELLSETGLRI